MARISPLPSSGWNWPDQAVQCSIRAGAPIAEPGESGWCHLVEEGLAAIYVTVDHDRATCVGLTGPGELIGLDDLFGGASNPTRHARAVTACRVLRIPLAAMQEGFRTSPVLRTLCSRQLQARVAELQSMAACNARHLLPERCAHWLLKLQSRLGDTLPVTHEFLATVLGVRRAGVTVTLQSLQRDGAIRQQRGSIGIMDMERLRHAACSCPLRIPDADNEVLMWAPDPAAIVAPVPIRLHPRAMIGAIAGGALAGKTENPVARIDVVLDVCRSVIASTQEFLGA